MSDLRVALTLTGKDDGASAAVKSLKGNTDALGQSFQDFTAKANAAEAVNARAIKTTAQATAAQTALNAAMKAGAIEEDAYASKSAAIAAAATKIEQANAKAAASAIAHAAATKGATAATQGFTLATAGAQRELGVLAGELARGNTAQFEKSLITLARQSGLLQLAFSATGLAVGALLAVVGGAVAVYASAAKQQDEFNRALIETGHSAGLSAADLKNQVSVIGAATGSYSDAAEALTKLAAEGHNAGAGLENSAQGVVAFAHLTGESIEKAVSEYEKLAANPVQGLEKLSESWHFLTAAQDAEVRMLVEIGDKTAAAQLAQDILTQAAIDRNSEYSNTLSGWAKLWRSIKEEISSAGQAAKNAMPDLTPRSAVTGLGGLVGASFGSAQLGASIASRFAPQDFSNVSQGVASSAQIKSAEDLAKAQREVEESGIAANAAFAKETEGMDKLVQTFGKGKAGLVEYTIAQQIHNAELIKDPAARQKAIDYINETGSVALASAKKVDALTVAHKSAASGAGDAARVYADLNKDLADGIRIATAVTGATDGQTAAYATYLEKLDRIKEAEASLPALRAQGRISAEQEAKDYQLLADGAAALTANYDLLIAKKQALSAVNGAEGSATDSLQARWADELASIGADSTAHQILTAQLAAEKEAQRALSEEIKAAPTAEAAAELATHRDALMADADAYAVNSIAAKKNAEQAKEWQKIWTSAGDSLAQGFGKVASDVIFNFKSIGDTFKSIGQVLKNTAQQVVQQIISEFIRLKIIGPILNSIFGGNAGSFSGGGGGSSLIGLASSGLGLGGFTGQGASVAAGGAGGGYGSTNNLLSMGQTIYKGFSGGFSSLQTGAGNVYARLTGAQTYTPAIQGYGPSAEYASDFTGPPSSLAGGGPGSYGGYGSGFGQAVGVAGGVVAGYNRFQNSNKDAGGALGGVAYGVGTYYAGAALATGATAAAAGGVTAGAAAGMAAIPVVGWIALACIAVDYLSGGKLFGTKGKLDSSKTTLNVDAEGASLGAQYTLKGQKAFFGGAKWSTHDAPVSAEAQAAATDFYNALKADQTAFAKEFNAKAGDLVGGTFVETFDKHNKSTGTVSTINGQTYKGETQDQFGQRLVDENRLAILDTFDSKLSGMLDSYRKTADGLTSVVTALTEGEAAFKAGANILALGSDQSLSALLKLAEGAAGVGESIDKTVDRLLQAQAKYDQFTGQFKPAPTFASAFQASLSNISATYAANIKQANALAVAAGAAGASVSDLANIAKYSAAQLASAINQLKNASQSLANDLGYTTQGETVDQLNSQINAIMQSAQQASPAIGGFGSAMTEAANAAQQAINRLIGDLSPLNDQQKLQTALKGQRDGLVTPEQVLEIGRRLFASSAAYTALFNQVQGVGDRTGKDTSGGGGGPSGGVNLSGAQQAAIGLLEKQRDAALKDQRHSEALQLAHNIADLSQSTGESFDDTAKGLGFKIEDVMKDLGLSDRKQFDKLLADYEKTQSSAGDDNKSLIAAILSLPQSIADAIAFPAHNSGNHNGVNVDPNDAATQASHPGRTQDTFIGHHIAHAIINGIQQVRRPGGRGPNIIQR